MTQDSPDSPTQPQAATEPVDAGGGVHVAHRARCPYCHTEVSTSAQKTACTACMAWHHAACWSEHGGCSTCGSDSGLTAPHESSAESADAAAPARGPIAILTIRDDADPGADPRRFEGEPGEVLERALREGAVGLAQPVLVFGNSDMIGALRVTASVEGEPLLRLCAPRPTCWWPADGDIVLVFAGGEVSGGRAQAQEAAISLPGDCRVRALRHAPVPVDYYFDVPEPEQHEEPSESRLLVLRMAEAFVHAAHAQMVLAARHPGVDPTLLAGLYWEHVNTAALGSYDPRPEMVIDPNLAVVRGLCCWLHAETLVPMSHLSKGALKTLPWTLHLDGALKWKPHPMKVETAASTSRMTGYVPIRPVRGAVLRPEGTSGDEVVVEVQPRGGDPVRLLQGEELLDLDHAFERLEFAFPGVNRTYVRALLAGAACSEVPRRPAMIFATGPTGSGKGETARLAASFLGDDPPKISANAPDDRFVMQVGSALEEGRRFLLVDEVGKVKAKDRLLRRLLEVSTTVTWRPLYVTSSATTMNRAVMVLAHLSIPSDWCASPEFVRRVRTLRLSRTVARWERTCGGDSVSWRSRSSENARVANSILTHAVHLAQRHAYDWEGVADELGLGRPEVDQVDHDVLRQLYAHVRDEDGHRETFKRGRFAQAGWVSLRSEGAREMIEALLPDDSQPGWDAFKHRLESVDWNRLLDLESEVDIICEVRFHGRQRAIRFRGPGARGQWRLNEALPPARSGQDAGRTDRPSTP